MGICNPGRGFELGMCPENKSRKWRERDLNSEPLNCDSTASPLGNAASYNRLLLNTQQRNDTNVTWPNITLGYITL